MWFEEYDQISFEEDFVKVKYKEFIIIDSNDKSTQIDLQN